MSGHRFVDVRRFESIDSTNRYLLDEARAGAPDGVVAVADFQTAGRGRLGRRWEAPAGSNLLLSVLLRPDVAVTERHLVTAAVALAAVDAVHVMPTMGSGSVGIKWPNDLVCPDGRKVAGVLAEADLIAGRSGAPPPVVVGIGINVNWPAADGDLPPELVGTATSLRQLAGGPVDRDALLDGLLSALDPRVDALASGSGRTALAADLAAVCTTVGAWVRVDLAGEAFEGTAVAITAEGHLTVSVDGQLRQVAAGDVVHVRPGG